MNRAERRLDHAIRVNHAGEYGAVRIYDGQMAVLGSRAAATSLAHMRAQEVAHLRYFTGELQDRAVRPTALLPLWHIGGFVLGAVTALIGTEAAMACTVAVEDTVEQHYASQLAWIPPDDSSLRDNVTRIRDEELQHRASALDQGATLDGGYGVLYQSIAAICRIAIAISKRI